MRLGDGLEASVVEASGIGLVDRYGRANDLRNEDGGVRDGAVSRYPDVAGHVDYHGTAAGKVVRCKLTTTRDSAVGSEIGLQVADLADAVEATAGVAGVVRGPNVELTIDGDRGWVIDAAEASRSRPTGEQGVRRSRSCEVRDAAVGSGRGDEDVIEVGNSDAIRIGEGSKWGGGVSPEVVCIANGSRSDPRDEVASRGGPDRSGIVRHYMDGERAQNRRDLHGCACCDLCCTVCDLVERAIRGGGEVDVVRTIRSDGKRRRRSCVGEHVASKRVVAVDVVGAASGVPDVAVQEDTYHRRTTGGDRGEIALGRLSVDDPEIAAGINIEILRLIDEGAGAGAAGAVAAVPDSDGPVGGRNGEGRLEGCTDRRREVEEILKVGSAAVGWVGQHVIEGLKSIRGLSERRRFIGPGGHLNIRRSSVGKERCAGRRAGGGVIDAG